MPSYQKDPSSGYWTVRFRERSPEDGLLHNKRLSNADGKRFKTKKEAVWAYEQYLVTQAELAKERARAEAIAAQPREILFSELVEAFMNYKRTRVRGSTQYDNKNKIHKRILPFFESMKVAEITPLAVLEWQDTLERYSYNYRKTLFGMLSSIFLYGEKYHGIKNIMKSIDRPRNLEAKKEMQIWTPDEFQQFIEVVDRPERAALFRFMFFTGCRRGEAVAVQWSDIDLDAAAVYIHQSVTNKAHDLGKPYAITPTKTYETRMVTLPYALCEYLRAYRASLVPSPRQSDFAFGGERPMPFSTIDNCFRKYIAAAGVKRIRQHDLRHSCASILIHSGVSIVAVSHHLGHRDIEETLNTYAHMLPDDRDAIRNAVNAVADALLPPKAP